MKILFVTPFYKPYLGGVERVVEQFSLRLLQRPEVEAVGILTSFYRYPVEIMAGLPEEEVIDGTFVYRLPFRPRRLPMFYHLDTGLYASKMGKVLRRFQPTHIHIQMYDWFLPNLQAFLLAPPETARVQTIYDHHFTRQFRLLPFIWVNRWTTGLAEAVHAVSERGSSNIQRDFAVPADKIHMIPLGTTLFPPRTMPTEENRPLTILSVGRISQRKGQLDLLKALVRIGDKHTRPWQLILVGDDGGMETTVRDFVKSHSLNARVKITGHVSQQELEDWYRRADLFALLTGDESFGLVFTEAMAAGLPVLTCDVGPLRGLLQKGAVIVPHGDAAATVQALQELLNNDEKRRQLAKDAYAFVRDHLSWDSVVDQMLRLYRNASALRRGLPT